MSYNELHQYIQNYPLDLVTINNFNDLRFYETVVKALKWETQSITIELCNLRFKIMWML